jgi:hypothetical protein
MGIHAKSLNQLVDELEGERNSLCQNAAPRPHVDEMQALIKGLQALAREFAQQQEVSPPSVTQPASDASREPSVLMDSTLGVRARPHERAELHKAERVLRLDMGFVSRGDISGES